MKKTHEKDIQILQDNLSLLRKLAKWTMEELGEQVGLTKQTISNIENKKSIMTLIQYIAIRTAFDYEIQTNPDNVVLAQAVDILLNKADSYNEEESEKIKATMGLLSAAAAGGAKATELSKTATMLFSSMGIAMATPVALVNPLIGAALAGGVGLWYSKIAKKSKEASLKKK